MLKDTEIGAFDDVVTLLNQPECVVREAIDDFFNQKMPDDLLVLYFSGHGVRDEIGALYLAVKNTIRSKLRATGIKSDYIREAMDQSRSRRQVLVLDCCNSGAFAQGTKAEIGGSVGTKTAFEGGYGRVILTASDSTQFAWEGDKVIGQTDNSLFTHYLVEGLEGKADRDGDGHITVDELYEYAYEKVRLATPKQTPSKFSTKEQGKIVLRQNIRIEDIKPIALPDELLDEIEDTRPYVREAAVQKLEKILKSRNIGLARSAREALEKLTTDENTTRRVGQLATQALESVRQAEMTAEERKATEEVSRLLAEQKDKEHQLATERAETERKFKEDEQFTRQKVPEKRFVEEKAITESQPKDETNSGQSFNDPAKILQTVDEQSSITASNKSPIVAALLSYFLCGGAGQIYLGQIKKGVALIIVTFFTSFILIGMFVNLAGTIDAYRIGKKISRGHSVGEWEFDISWRAFIILTALVVIPVIIFVVYFFYAGLY